MHGTVMIFLAVVPLGAGAFGNCFVPAEIGADEMAFPRLNALSYWVYLVAGLVMVASFFAPGGAASSGWTSYAPLAVFASAGQTFWLAGIFLVGVSSALGAINMIATIARRRAPGFTWMTLPFFVWSQLVTAVLLLLAFPALQAAAVLQLMDRLAGTSFFVPSGLVVGGVPLQSVSGGGDALLWQHLFWFLAHPEVYVLVLPAMGIVSEVIAANARRPLWGYRLAVASVIFMGVMSVIVWAHHMFLAGMGTTLASFFQVTTLIISVPSVVIASALVLTLWGGSIRFNTAMLFALAFLPMFGIGGLTGLPLGLAASDVALHDTYYVVAHFHYLVAPGALFALFAGIYHWWPRLTGRSLNERLGQVHFWGSFVLMNAVFLPMFAMGLMGVNRRLYDAGLQYALAQPALAWQPHMTYAAAALGLFQIPIVVNLFWRGGSGTVPPENVAGSAYSASTSRRAPPAPPVSPALTGIYLLLASELMFFGSLFAACAALRMNAAAWPAPVDGFPWLETALLVGASACLTRSRGSLIGSAALATAFVGVRIASDAALVGAGLTPAVNLMLACRFTIAGVHAAHVFAGAVATFWLAAPSWRLAHRDPDRWLTRLRALRLYWLFVDAVWIAIVVSFY
jgi:cytochrome c oxidase subunit 1